MVIKHSGFRGFTKCCARRQGSCNGGYRRCSEMSKIIIAYTVVRNAKMIHTMNQLSLLLCLVISVSCNQYSQTKNDNKLKSDKTKYAAELIDNDFLKYADSVTFDSLKTQLINEFDIYDDSNFKIVHIDAEELAEFNFDFFLPNLNKILSKRNINISAQKVNNHDNSFDVLINGEQIRLYTQSELDNYSFWDTSSRNFFRQVNKIMKLNNSNEQFYLLYGGNDLHILLLTDKQFSIITDYYKDNDKEKPYKP